MSEKEREKDIERATGQNLGWALALVQLSSLAQLCRELRDWSGFRWPHYFSTMSSPWPLTPIWSEDYSQDLGGWELLSDMTLSISPVGTISWTPKSDLLYGIVSIVCFPCKCLSPQFVWCLEGTNYVVFSSLNTPSWHYPEHSVNSIRICCLNKWMEELINRWRGWMNAILLPLSWLPYNVYTSGSLIVCFPIPSRDVT